MLNNRPEFGITIVPNQLLAIRVITIIARGREISDPRIQSAQPVHQRFLLLTESLSSVTELKLPNVCYVAIMC